METNITEIINWIMEQEEYKCCPIDTPESIFWGISVFKVAQFIHRYESERQTKKEYESEADNKA